ncbi:MAG: hypothetical protein JNL58_25990 [Planctomyces sp.]|nr:hypothetical protein [Planctomyces sp.]
MASSNNQGLVITLSLSILLTVVLGVFMYLTMSNNSDLQRQLADRNTAATSLEGNVRDLNAELTRLKELIGRPVTDESTKIVEDMSRTIAETASNGATVSPNLDGALSKVVADRNGFDYAATERLDSLNAKQRQLQETIQSKDGEIATHQAAAQKAETTLREQEVRHSEALAQRESEINDLRTKLQAKEVEFSTLKTQTDREREALTSEIADWRKSVVDYRRRLFEQEDLSFERADGLLTFVDQDRLRCYVNLGENDELQVGTTFSVYRKSNNGVGRGNMEDIKGKIEIISLMGPHQAEARIVFQETGSPLAANDPVYSPLFASGQKLEVALVGLINFDGFDGSDRDRDELRRMVAGTGTKIAIQVNSVGELTTEDGQRLNEEDIETLITEKTRFLVVGDIDSETDDTVKKDIYRKIARLHGEMRDQAEMMGVRVVSLSSFLEYIGYSKKRVAWTPTDPFPAVLPNGGKSSEANGTFGNRESSAAISGRFSGRRSQTSTSTGNVSKLYQNP